MYIFELQQKLREELKRDVTQAEIGKSLGITRSYVNKKLKNDIEISDDEIYMIAHYFKVDYTKLTQANSSKERVETPEEFEACKAIADNAIEYVNLMESGNIEAANQAFKRLKESLKNPNAPVPTEEYKKEFEKLMQELGVEFDEQGYLKKGKSEG